MSEFQEVVLTIFGTGASTALGMYLFTKIPLLFAMTAAVVAGRLLLEFGI